MRRAIVSCATMGVLAAGAYAAADADASLEQNKQLVRKMVAAINERDLDALDALVAPDVERHCAATPAVQVHDLDQFKAFLRQDLTTIPDSRQEIQQLLAEGDLVAARVLYSGTQTGPMGSFPASGRRLELPFISILRIADGRIAEIWVEWDNMAALAQLGHLQPPGMNASAATEAANKALARRWFDDVINGRNLDAIPEIYAAEYVHHGPAGADMSGLDTVRSFAAEILAASADRHAVVEEQVADGDRVVTRFASRGSRTGSFRGIPPSGQEWITEGIVISRIHDGKIVEDWEIVSASGL